MKKTDKKFGRKLTASILAQFVITVLIFTAALTVAVLMAFTIGHSIVWHEGPGYWFAKTIADWLYIIVSLVWIVGVIFILYHYWSKTIGYIEKVVEESKTLTRPGEDLIQLPAALKEVEDRMNQIKYDILRSERVAEAAEQRKNDLIVYLAHDLKTPLTSVIGYLSLLDEAPDMPPEQKAKYIGITLEKAYRLEQLINEFFEITRFNLQTIVLNKEKINLPYMLRQMADEFYPMLTPQGKRVVVNAPDGLTLWGDADKLARVFNNILKNAIAYSYDDSVIDISANQQEENVAITFTNQGNPIPPQKLDTIFDKFYRLDISRSSKTGGVGLGLAIAKEIVTAHSGSISVHSDNAQTVFTVILPPSP